MREKTCCFTGHRDIPAGEMEAVQARLKQTILALYNRGIRCFIAGGALGFDTLAAETVLHLRESHPDMKLYLALPCLTQTQSWRAEDIVKYEDIKQRANDVVYTSQKYSRGCMHIRNRHMVDNSSVCICYKTRDTGGTAYTVKYARANRLKVINVS